MLQSWVSSLNELVWGPAMLAMILGTGLFLTAGLKLLPLRKLRYGFTLLWQGRKTDGSGQITSFNALMTALAATIGTGNIAGVATAIVLGGPGALFWMWCTALIGMATKYAEAILAVKYRETDETGEYVGGPMYYIKNGLPKKWWWLGTAFAVFGTLAGFGIGNTVQSNSVVQVLHDNFGFDKLITSIILAALVASVILGGITRIAQVAGKLVPFMAIAYTATGLIILLLHANEIPHAITLIIKSAFTGHAASGGFAGAAVWAAIRFGVARGVFSNESGLGSAPIAHAAAQTSDPVRQGIVAMLGTFIDTICICSITGLAIIVTGVWDSGNTGAVLTSTAFAQAIWGGNYIVSISLAIFAFTTILGWSIYGERCVIYLFGKKCVLAFRLAWIIAIPIGAMVELDFIWLLADTLNALMAIPNLIALILLSPVVFKLSQEYFGN